VEGDEGVGEKTENSSETYKISTGARVKRTNKIRDLGAKSQGNTHFPKGRTKKPPAHSK